MAKGPQLAVADVSVSYGDLTVIREASMAVDEADIVAIVGANGAGKTTLLKTIAGVKEPDTGSIRFEGDDIVGAQPHEIIRRGIVYVPERHRIFPEMTVRENLQLAREPVSADTDSSFTDDLFDLFPILEERQQQDAGTMSGGQQQMLALAQGLAADPDVLMLDEPTLGLAPQIVEDVVDAIRTINDDGVTILLVEEKVELAQSVADAMYLMRRETLSDLGERGEFEDAYDDATSGMRQ